MDFNLYSIFAGLIFGVIGLSLFRQGKKNSNMLVLIIGILMMGFPYFIDTVWVEWCVGIGLCFAAKAVWNR